MPQLHRSWAQPVGQRVVVGGDHRRAVSHHPREQIGTTRVEARIGLVQHQQRGVVQDRPADRQPLLSAPRQLPGRSAGDVAKADQVEHLGDAPAVDALQGAEKLEVFGGRQREVQPGRVRDVADSRPQPPAPAKPKP